FFAHRAARGFVRDLARHSGLSEPPAWLADWAVLEVSACVGRSMLRTILAHARATTPLTALFQAASQASLRWKGAEPRLKRALRRVCGTRGGAGVARAPRRPRAPPRPRPAAGGDPEPGVLSAAAILRPAVLLARRSASA